MYLAVQYVYMYVCMRTGTYGQQLSLNVRTRGLSHSRRYVQELATKNEPRCVLLQTTNHRQGRSGVFFVRASPTKVLVHVYM